MGWGGFELTFNRDLLLGFVFGGSHISNHKFGRTFQRRARTMFQLEGIDFRPERKHRKPINCGWGTRTIPVQLQSLCSYERELEYRFSAIASVSDGQVSVS